MENLLEHTSLETGLGWKKMNTKSMVISLWDIPKYAKKAKNEKFNAKKLIWNEVLA